jgi:hypothetical protein
LLSTYTVYHACSTEGDFAKVLKLTPFHSDQTREQWLTQGYYFWRSQTLANQWGTTSYSADGDFAVLKAKLHLTEDELFDLSANTEHIEYFEKLLSKFMNFKRRELGNRYEPTVSACLEYFRRKAKISPAIFPYIAIMATEEAEYKKDYKFIEGKKNCLAFNKRVQICLFEGYKGRINDKVLICPEAWVA